MQITLLLQSLRTPFADAFFSLITKCGEETVFMLVCFFVFWCVDKRKGYYLLFVSFWGVFINQFLKIWFHIPRPWVRDARISPVESAVSEATGYSFPSGHTQVSVGTYGALCRAFSSVPLRIVCFMLCVVVPFSRMYLGVHTAWDVLASLAIALVLIFILYPVTERLQTSKNGMRWMLLAMVFATVLYLAYVKFASFPPAVDSENIAVATEYAYKLFGLSLGAFLGYEIDQRYVRFETDAPLWAQILKVAFGFFIVLGLQKGLKQPLYAILSAKGAADAFRYGLLTLFAVGIWPMSFARFSKFKKQK